MSKNPLCSMIFPFFTRQRNASSNEISLGVTHVIRYGSYTTSTLNSPQTMSRDDKSRSRQVAENGRHRKAPTAPARRRIGLDILHSNGTARRDPARMSKAHRCRASRRAVANRLFRTRRPRVASVLQRPSPRPSQNKARPYGNAPSLQQGTFRLTWMAPAQHSCGNSGPIRRRRERGYAGFSFTA